MVCCGLLDNNILMEVGCIQYVCGVLWLYIDGSWLSSVCVWCDNILMEVVHALIKI